MYLWIALLIACALIIVLKGKLGSGLDAFIPRGNHAGQNISGIDKNSTLLSRLLIITVEGDEQKDLAVVSKNLKKILLKLNQFEFVSNGQDDADGQLKRMIFRYRYLLSDRFDNRPLDSEKLSRSLQALVPRTFSHLYPFNKDRLLADPTLETDYLVRRMQGKSDMGMAYGVWFNAAADSAILLTYLKQDVKSDDDRQALMGLVEQEFSRLESTRQQMLRFTGPATFSVTSRDIIKSEVRYLSITGSLLIVILLYFSYRRKRLMLLVAVPVVTAILVASAVTILVYGHIHGITLAFGITLLGICIDYPIHLFSHARNDERLQYTIISIWPVIRLGVITTVTGFVLMMFSDMSGLVQLGLFTLTGIVVAALITRWVLPVLINDVHLIRQHGLFELTNRIKPPLVLVYVITTGIVVSALLVYVNISEPIIATRLGSLNPVPKAELRRYESLRNDIGLPQSYQYITVDGDSIESVLREEERIISDLRNIDKNQRVDGYIHAARYLPSVYTQKMRQAALPDRASVGTMLKSILTDLPFKNTAFNPFSEDLEQSRILLPLTYEDMRKTYLGAYLSSLLFATSTGWRGLIFVDKSFSMQDYGHVLQPHYATHNRFYNLKDETELLFNDYRDSIIDKVQIASLVILLVLFAGLRSLRGLVRVVAPVLLTIVLTTLVIYQLQGPLTIFHLIALILVFGIGVDYSLFFNASTDDESYVRTFHAVSVCALSTLAVFGLLASSDIIVLKSIGFTVATGTVLAYLLSCLYSTRAA